jgi:hypothetical protein
MDTIDPHAIKSSPGMKIQPPRRQEAPRIAKEIEKERVREIKTA